MKKQIFKTLFLIFSISLSLITFVNITEAFLDSDLWLNLYKDLDEGLDKFEEQMYVYELSEQKKQDISKSVNKILFNKWIWNCLIDWVTPAIIESIVKWNLEVVTSNMKEECYNPETKEFSSKKVWNIVAELWNIKEYYLNKSDEKAKSIHEISRVWMYSDWNTDNSPFDIIADLNDINAIIFTEEMEYEYEEYDFLKKYKQDKPLIWPLWNKLWWNNWWGGWSGAWWNNNSNSNQNTDTKSNNHYNNWTNNNLSEPYINNQETTPDWNNFLCPVYENDSWLNNNSLNSLVSSLEWNNITNVWYVYNYWDWNSWHIPLPETNAIVSPPSLLWSDFASQLVENWISPYEKVTDNDIWKCNEYFCIITEFIVRNQQALDYWVSHSIQNIVERSNKHLKKSANTSLVQSKMTINNFEISLRDLNLPDMFHMWINMSYKTPPILNIENLHWDTHKESSREVENMLRKKYKNIWLDYSDPNNLNKFSYALRKMKEIFLTTENPSNYRNTINEKLWKILKLRTKILDYNKEIIHKDINNDIIKDFNKQFTEISQFNVNILDYIHSLDTLTKKLKEIPTYSW